MVIGVHRATLVFTRIGESYGLAFRDASIHAHAHPGYPYRVFILGADLARSAMAAKKEPSARAYHGAAADAYDRMCVWGGDGRYIETSSLERFDVSSATWETAPMQLVDSLGYRCLPDGLQRMAIAPSPTGKVYSFGGQISDDAIDDKYINDVYEIDLVASVCRPLVYTRQRFSFAAQPEERERNGVV